MKIRLEKKGDEEGIRQLVTACFATPGEAKLVDALRDAGELAVSVVCDNGPKIAGYAALSPVRIDGLVVGAGLGPVAVSEESRGQGVGAKLVDTALEFARGLGFPIAVVLGEPAYYARFGFRPASQFLLEDIYGGGAAFQALELRPGGKPAKGGVITYSAPFSLLS